MKTKLRIMNFIILFLSGAAIIFLLVVPIVRFNASVDLNTQYIINQIPQSEATKNIDLNAAIGNQPITYSININLTPKDGFSMLKGATEEQINQYLFNQNVENIVTSVTNSLSKIAEPVIKAVFKSTVNNQTTKYIEQYKGDAPVTTQEIMQNANLDDAYFDTCAAAIYTEGNKTGATTDNLTDIIYTQIETSLQKVSEQGIDTSSFNESEKPAINNAVTNGLSTISMVETDNKTLVPFSDLPNVLIANSMKKELVATGVDETTLGMNSNETRTQYTSRLTLQYLTSLIGPEAYSILSYSLMSITYFLIALIVIWGFLFVFTFLRTLCKNKVWTIFGPLFWFFGILQFILGIAGTVTCATILNINLFRAMIPTITDIFNSLTFMLITSALFTSVIFVVCIPLAIVYGVYKRKYKRELRNPNNNNQDSGNQKIEVISESD